MAAALFAAQTRGLTGSVEVSSAGLLSEVRAVPNEVPIEVLEVMAPYGIDLRDHRSRQLTAAMVSGSDLVIGMGRRHIQEAVLLDPSCWPRAFMLKELVRRGNAFGPRVPSQTIPVWIDGVHGDRTRTSLAHRSSADEVADPYGGPLAQYWSTATELGLLVARLTELLWPWGAEDPGR
jgi:protein-tyrosine-phosphatase